HSANLPAKEVVREYQTGRVRRVPRTVLDRQSAWRAILPRCRQAWVVRCHRRSRSCAGLFAYKPIPSGSLCRRSGGYGRRSIAFSAERGTARASPRPLACEATRLGAVNDREQSLNTSTLPYARLE